MLSSNHLNSCKDGLLLLDKPSGMSSNAALQKVKRLLKLPKAGHTGSLDPLATGVLPICMGEATKFAQYLLDDTKQYYVEIELGKKTDSGDIEGKIIAQADSSYVTFDMLQKHLAEFKGEIYQIPPMYSALKYQGQPLYRLARKGIEIPREARPITIYALELQSFTQNKVCLTVHCSKGTYIRSLVMDLGDALGCGAVVTALRRTKVANFSLKDCVTLEELGKIEEEVQKICKNFADKDDKIHLNLNIYPVSILVQTLPKLVLTNQQIQALYYGQIFTYEIEQLNAFHNMIYAVYDEEDKFLGVAMHVGDNQLKAKRLLRAGYTAHTSNSIDPSIS